MSYEIKFHQIMPCPVPMEAVYYDFDTEELERINILCLAIIRPYPEITSKDTGIRIIEKPIIHSDWVASMIICRDGDIIPADWQDGFLGIEVEGKALNWDEEVRELEANRVVDGRRFSS